MKKTVAIVANTTWNIYNFRQNIIQGLLQNGFDVVIIAPVDRYIHYLKAFPGIRHIPLRSLSRKGKNPVRDFRLWLELCRIYRMERPDAVIHYTIKPNIYGSLAAWWRGVKNIAVVTGLGYTFLHNGWLYRVVKRLYRLSFRLADRVVFENAEDRDLFIREGLVAENKSLAVRGCGVNLRHFRPEDDRFVAPDPKKTVFTFIGRLLYDKGVVEYVEAARQVRNLLPNVEFRLVGDVDKHNPASIEDRLLARWVQENVVTYLGSVEDIRPCISRSHCIVLPSYREGLSRVLQEALAMGKPVITSEVAGCRDVVEPGRNGLLVPAGNAEALASAMLTLYALGEQEMAAMGANSRRKAETEYDDRIIAGQYLEMLAGMFGQEELMMPAPVPDKVVL